MSKTGYTEAAHLARQAHAGQVDKGGNDYFATHIESVVRIVREDLGGSIRDAVVAYLHDIVEDTDVTLADIDDLFGAEVAADVDALTRRDSETYAAFIGRVAASSKRARTVKLADILDHLNNGTAIPDSLRKRYEKAAVRLVSTRKHLFAMADERGYIRRPGLKNPTLHISEDGTITRADTDLTLCRAMTVSEAVHTLNA